MGEWVGATSWDLSGFIIKRKEEGKKTTFFLIPELMSSFYHRLLLLVWQERFFVCLFVLVPIWSNQDCHGTMQQSPLASVQCLSFTLKCHLSINCCFCVCWEHVLGVINLLSSLGRIWVSYHHCVIVFRNILFLSHDFVAKQAYVVLWLNKPAFLSNHWHTVFSRFLLITIP